MEHNFTKHERLNVKGVPDMELIWYNARRFQLNQISCLELTMDLTTENGLVRWQAVYRTMQRLYCVSNSIAVSVPHWSSLITLKGMTWDADAKLILTNENSD